MSMTISDPGSNLGMSAITVDDTQSLAKFYEKNEEYRDTESEYEGRESLNKKINFHIGDITDFSVDAIICSVQPVLTCKPFGMHRRVISRAGPVYEETFVEVGYCKAGEAFITEGFDLHAKYIIHTAGPSPDTTLDYEEKKSCLSKSYLSCLEIVKQSQDIRTFAFPCLGCGGGGIQTVDAIETAVTMLRQWLETDNNLTQVDRILLVMYDENQWNDYSKELFKTFPYGKDLAGIDLETLTCVEMRTLEGFVPQTAIASNILCYQYRKSAVRQVGKHLHSLVNQLQADLGTRSEPTERYRNCGTFLINKVHRVVVYHGKERCMIEVQVISYSDSLDASLVELCEKVQLLVSNYLTTNLENLTKHKTYIRCDNSTWGDADGMKGTGRLTRRMARSSTMQCRHRKSRNNLTHSVSLSDIAKFWIQQDQCSFNQEPDEHNELAEESEDSASWPSLASLSSSDSGGKPELKVNNVTSATRPLARVPVEHCDDDSLNPFHKVKNFVKGKIQLLTKSNKDITDITETEHNSQSSNYQPFNDSLLPSECQQQPARERELQENTNIYSKYNTSDIAQASEPRYGELPKCQNHQKPTKESGQNNCTSGCSKMTNTAWQNEQTSVGRSRNRISTGSGQRTESDEEGSVSANVDFEQEQFKHGGSIGSLSHNSDCLGACGRSSASSISVPNNLNSSEMTRLSDKMLLNVARKVGIRETQLGLELGLSYESIQRIKAENFADATMQAFCILREWKIQQRGKASMETLLDAMTFCSIDTTLITI